MAVDPGEVVDVDVALVARIAGGDRAALSELYRRHASALLGLAIRIVRDRREAEDLLHDVFLEVWRAAASFDPARGRVHTWLNIRMRSRALDQQKSARVSRNAGDGLLEWMLDDADAPNPDHVRIRTALADLSADHRAVLELAYVAGMSCTEIADRLAIPVGTVKSRVAAGLDRLRTKLQRGARQGGRILSGDCEASVPGTRRLSA